jgi:hypothetical protein
VEETRQIAEVRIHVERLIRRIKCFHLLDGIIPLTLHPMLEDIIHTCAYLTVFQSPICKVSLLACSSATQMIDSTGNAVLITLVSII